MPLYRKKPVVIEAHKWTGRNLEDIKRFYSMAELQEMHPYGDKTDNLEIRTLEGIMIANPGDYIINGVNGEFYPCKPDIFDKTYEPA